jgi:uncharacterized protein YjbJ (UPF0337 family)
MKNVDQVKGRMKQAAGDLTGNDRLQREGKTDRAAGKAKEVVDKGRDMAAAKVDALKDRIHQVSRGK